MGKIAACYIRESSEDQTMDPDRAREGQRLDCRRLAERDGYDPGELVEYDDWGRSGAAGKARPAQDRLIADMAAGTIAVVYARSEDRLMRDLFGMAQFEKTAREHGVRIVTEREGEITGEDEDTGYLQRTTRRMFAEHESRTAKLRRRKGLATQRRRIEAHLATGCPGYNVCGNWKDHQIGQPLYGAKPGEDIAVVIHAFLAANTYGGAAQLLTAAEVPPRTKGKDHWDATTVKRVIEGWTTAEIAMGHEPAITLPAKRTRGRHVRSTHLLAGLLICPFDGSILTTMPRKDGSTTYICRKAQVGAIVDGVPHPRPYAVSEARILPWAKRMAENMTRGRFEYRTATSDDSSGAIAAERANIYRAVAKGMPDAEADPMLAALDAREAALAAAGRARLYLWQERAFDWDDPAAANAGMKAVWRGIMLQYVETPTWDRANTDQVLAPAYVLPRPGVPDPATYPYADSELLTPEERAEQEAAWARESPQGDALPF
jgi:DNA invertase Pin-like site-specific DNA recombinase